MRAASSIRLAVVTETYPPDLNGVAMSLSRLIAGLVDRGHQIDLYRVRPRGERSAVAPGASHIDNPQVTALPGIPIPAYPDLKMGLPAGRLLASQWRAARPDLVHIATEGPLGWSALRAAKNLGIPVSTDFRTQFDHYSAHYGAAWMAKPIGAWLRAFHNRADLTTVPTQALKQELVSRGFRKLRVLGRGVDAGLFDPSRRCDTVRESWGAGPETLVALCVGRLAAEKNLGLAIDAFAAIHAAAPDSKLVFVGNGPLQQALAQACPQAVFAGRLEGEDLARHYASADLFVFPSLSETFGNVVTESMASGLATVAFRHAAAGDLIESGVNGLLADAARPGDFIAAAKSLAASAAQRRAMGERARESVLQLGWSSIVSQFEAMAAALIEGESLPQMSRSTSRLRASGTRTA